MDMEERYSRNGGALSAEEQRQLADASVLVLGCGGLGGYVIELLARIGVGRIAAADGDVFCVSNLNRQLLCTEETLGMNKALAAEARVRVYPTTQYWTGPVPPDWRWVLVGFAGISQDDIEPGIAALAHAWGYE